MAPDETILLQLAAQLEVAAPWSIVGQYVSAAAADPYCHWALCRRASRRRGGLARSPPYTSMDPSSVDITVRCDGTCVTAGESCLPSLGTRLPGVCHMSCSWRRCQARSSIPANPRAGPLTSGHRDGVGGTQARSAELMPIEDRRRRLTHPGACPVPAPRRHSPPWARSSYRPMTPSPTHWASRAWPRLVIVGCR